MKFAARAMLALSLVFAASSGQAAAPNPAHIKAVQDLLGAMQIEKVEEKKERKRPAYVKASKELADAEPAIEHEAFKLLQEINKEKR
jgi:hypothetical protein